ncbi:TetR/AcrR family transcriptional regulator [Yinghuangia soli]|uniref:TetR/AcrR family transcriptional regulator n=1 Tax=Yinghuangia soli TaxID=2908204 RepID=A0AA41U231_9ACTN|nr:TetR/AcrR family transcriptional regulator [Yinghuangia soli]MCF2530250.1 TetR/AcrR family transcriptional regulator [Yinghuangia soli]
MTDTSRTQFTVTHRLGPAERERRTAIAAAARELAAEHGYDATTVRDIAARAGTTPATVYRYFGSKDRLLHHIMVEWAGRTAAELAGGSYPGDVADRVSAAFQDIIRWAAQDLALLEAGIVSFRATADANDGLAVWQGLFTAFVRGALDDPEWADDEGKALTLGHVLVACMLDITSGRTRPEETCAHIDTAARLIFR